MQAVQELLAGGADPNGVGRRTPLMRAAAGGHAEMVRLLLEHGADPNAEDPRSGSTALSGARSPEVVALLLAHGAQWKAAIPTGWLTEQVEISSLPEWGDSLTKGRWEEFLSQVAVGDEIWHFHSPPSTWKAKMGLSGFAVVRDGTPIRVFVTVRN